MALFGLIKSGFYIKRYPDHLKDFASDVDNQLGFPIDHSPDGVAGAIGAATATGLSILWEQLQVMYESLDPRKAKGMHLDRLALGGRKKSANTTTTARIYGTAGYIIRAYEPLVVGTSDLWYTDQVSIINSAGYVDVTVVAETNDQPRIPAEYAMTTSLSNADITHATSLYASSVARSEETDDELRSRLISGQQSSSSTPYSRIMLSALESIPRVDCAVVSKGKIYLWGDYDKVLAANVIWDHSVFGMSYFGDTIADAYGCHQVGWYQGCIKTFTIDLIIKQSPGCCITIDKSHIIPTIMSNLSGCMPDCLTPYDIASAAPKNEGYTIVSIIMTEHNCITCPGGQVVDEICKGDGDKLELDVGGSSVTVSN